MRQSEAIQVLSVQDRKGRYVYTGGDLAKLFPRDGARALQAGLGRLVRSGLLLRAGRGVYVFALSRHRGPDTIEQVARTLRRGAYNYVSLESALSQHGAISQVPPDRLTVMTTGRKGEYATPFGVIEFTHTRRPLRDILAGARRVGRPLRLACKQAAWRDLRRVGRNTHLVDQEALRED